MTSQIDNFLYEISIREDAEITERIGFFQGLDLITQRERLRKHGVET
ncbi:MAG: hypothetical protein NWF11_02420 [Candidatus Bathyarchaeota archaeon]|nr:hypothetical protein [Candidatus Bathyarchaeota archaeon]